MLTYFVKWMCEISKFHVAAVQRRLRNVQKRVMHVQSFCFADLNLLFLFLFFVFFFLSLHVRLSTDRLGLWIPLLWVPILDAGFRILRHWNLHSGFQSPHSPWFRIPQAKLRRISNPDNLSYMGYFLILPCSQ